MITSLDQLDISKTYSYADYLKWQFEERVELIKGKIFKMPAGTNRKHQEISGIFLANFFWFLDRKRGQVYHAPFDVRLALHPNNEFEKVFTVVQPDISVFCDPGKLDDLGAIGAPDLIVEILIPGFAQTEMKTKFEVYEENGVKEYRIVDSANEVVLAYILNEERKYIGLPPFTLEDELTSHVFPDFKLNVADIFKD